MSIRSLCVFCGSRPGTIPAYTEEAYALGQYLARAEIQVVYGGSALGVMGAVADGALSEGGQVVGILPEGLASREKAHQGVTELVVVRSMHERKSLMEARSDGFIALPGGLGTLEELCEITTWAQLGIHRKPVGLLNTRGFFDGFIAFLSHATAQGFLLTEHRDLLLVHEGVQDLVEEMKAFKPFLKKVWLDRSEL